MSLFGWMIRSRGGPDDRTSLTVEPHWHVDGADFHRVLAALPGFVPEGSLLGFTGCAWPRPWSREVGDFLETWSTRPEPSALASVPREFAQARFLPIDARTMASLTDFEDCHANELAVHLIVILGRTSLVEWYDLPEGPIAVASSFVEASVERLAAAVGGTYEMSQAGT